MLAILVSLCAAQAPAEPFRPFWHELERYRGAQLGAIALASTDPELVLVTQPIRPEHPFRELIVSWNVDCPSAAGFTVELSVHDASGDSPWMTLGSWGAPAPSQKLTRFEHGLVDIDWFRGIDATFESAQVRFRRAPDAPSPKVAELALCFSDRQRASVELVDSAPVPHALTLAVPFHSQKSEDPSIAARICSPTSVTMVLGYHAIELAVRAVAERCFDREHDIYGNWPRNVQAAYSFGVSGYIDRFMSWADVERNLEHKTPLVCSITAKEGELSGAPYTKTDGHLLVLVGFDEQGNCLVNDPAAPDKTSVRRTYSRAQMETVWMKKGGVAYVFPPPMK